jgi:beta-xylosidase
VIAVGDRYYAYATQTGQINVQVMVSADLERWEHLGDALPKLPTWSGRGKTWSPSVLPREHGYVLFVAVHDRESGRQHIAMATATQPEGPFSPPSTAPFLTGADRGGCIDPSTFVDDDGVAYLLWKTDDDALGRPATLWGAQLAPDGLSLTGDPVELLRQSQNWERPRIESPSLTRGDGRYFLFYSAGDWVTENYATGYAKGVGPLGPFLRGTRRRPWMSSRQGVAGPGGAEVFTDRSGVLRIAYHAWHPAQVGYEAGGTRSLFIDRMGFIRRRPVLNPKS